MIIPLLTITSTLILNSPILMIAPLTMSMIHLSSLFYHPITNYSLINAFSLLDLTSISLTTLTLWTSTLMILSSSKIIINLNTHKLFIFMVATLNIVLVVAFTTNNIFLFYMFFESSLIPTLMLIIIWGYQPERLRASMYLLLYTMIASLPLLMSMSLLFMTSNSPSFSPINTPSLTSLTYLMFMLAFLVKMPLYLVHIWLPKAHVEAPVAGSMILASILLKLGSYGLMRFNIILPLMLKTWNTLLISISLWGALMTSIACIQQPDLKALIAYSSVAHMAIIIASLSSNSHWSQVGTMMMMLAHGLTSSGLFSLTNMQYENTHSRALLMNKGNLTLSPTMTLWWLVLLMANMSAPPTFNLLSEMFLLISVFTYSHMTVVILPMITLFSVIYSMMLFTNINHGATLPHTKLLKTPMNNFTTAALHASPAVLLLFSSSMFTH